MAEKDQYRSAVTGLSEVGNPQTMLVNEKNTSIKTLKKDLLLLLVQQKEVLSYGRNIYHIRAEIDNITLC